MGDRLVASLVPPRAAPGTRAGGEARPAIAVAPLPVVDIAVPVRRGSLHYGMGRIDASGRVSDKSMLRVLRWRHGQPLLITAIEGAVVVHPHPAEVVAFEADNVDPETHTGWSVVVIGKVRPVTNIDELVALADPRYRPWPGGERGHFLRISIDIISGRVLRLSEAEPVAEVAS